MRQTRRVVRYSNAFKRQLVERIESGAFDSIEQARRHFGISGASTIGKWLRRLGKNHLMPRVVRVETPDEKREIEQLRRQVLDLGIFMRSAMPNASMFSLTGTPLEPGPCRPGQEIRGGLRLRNSPQEA